MALARLKPGVSMQQASEEVRSVWLTRAPDMTEVSLRPMEEGIAQLLGERRLALELMASFAAVALLLAAVGIYGLLAYSVAQRRKEIGIRMALGSSQAGITGFVLQQAATMVVCGLVLGVATAWPVRQMLRSFLFGVGVLDPWALAASAGVLLVVGAVAVTVPTWRATQVNPTEALRTD